MAEKFINLDNLTYYDSKIKLYADNKYEKKDSTIVKDSNYVHTDNNYTSIDKQKLDAMSNGSKYIGLFPTLIERDIVTNLISGYWCTINVDSSHSNKKTKYYYDGTQWIYDGEYQDDSFLIDDTSTTSTSAGWSSNKINTELGLKADNTSIPTKTSQLTNDSNYLTQSELTNNYTNNTDLQTNYALKSDLTGKVNSSDIIDNLTSTDTTKPLSANQGSVIKGLIDGKPSVNDSATTSTTDTYSIDKVITLLNNKQNKITISSTEPTTPSLEDIWIDTTNVNQYILRVYNGTSFVQAGGSSGGGTSINKWISGTLYEIDVLVIHNGNLYQCLTQNVDSVFDIAKWSLIGSPSNTFSNQGSGVGVYSQTVGNDVQFRSIKAGTNVNISQSVGEVVISANVTGNANGSIDYGTSTSSAFNYDNTKIDFDTTNVKLKANDIVDTNTKLLMHMNDSTFKDECGKSVTNSSVTLNTTNKVFGTGSAYFNGTNSGLTSGSDTSFDLKNGDFTIEFYIKPTKDSWFNIVCSNNYSESNKTGWAINSNYQSARYICMISMGNNGINTCNLNVNLFDGNFHHVSFVKHNSDWLGFFDGVLLSTTPYILYNGNASYISIGKQMDGNASFGGYIDEFRISNIARWTSNFTPPTYMYGTNYNTTQYNQVSLKSTQLLDASKYYQINGITITDNMPIGTDIKYALDVGTTYPKVWNGSAWVDCTDVSLNGMSKSDLSVALTNYSWNGLGNKFGIVASLKSSDASVTPTIDNIAINYLASPNILAGHIVTDGTTTFNQRANLKFIGATVTDDSPNNSTVVTISGGSVDITTLPTF